jgi:glycolate oxidase
LASYILPILSAQTSAPYEENVATNAGGLCCIKYGTICAWVTGLEVTAVDGTTWRTGGRITKSAVGYDLTGLLVGFEGTLAAITEVTVRLAPAPPPRAR